MTERLYLSYWIRGFTDREMFRYFGKLMDAFPFSRLEAQAPVLRVLAVDSAGPPVLERAFPAPVEIPEAIAAAREFAHADCSIEMDCRWDLFQLEEDWALRPAPVTLICYGPEFEHDSDENLRLELGLESMFLPRAELPGGVRTAQSNIRSLLKLTHDLDDSLGAARRQLWSESGENFAARLEAALRVGT